MSEGATTTHPPSPTHTRRVLRSVGAVLAGLLANIVLAGAIDAALRATGTYPPMFQPMADHLWALALTTRIVFAVVGGFLTARLAPPPPARPMRHVMVLGGIETVLSVLFVLVNWNKGPEFGPHWFAISVAITALPCTALGGVLHAKRIARTHQ
jgi:peptidoglycan/LPS O-acetylase OafA/YrhL